MISASLPLDYIRLFYRMTHYSTRWESQQSERWPAKMSYQLPTSKSNLENKKNHVENILEKSENNSLCFFYHVCVCVSKFVAAVYST